jgi:hypothetical protein
MRSHSSSFADLVEEDENRPPPPWEVIIGGRGMNVRGTSLVLGGTAGGWSGAPGSLSRLNEAIQELLKANEALQCKNNACAYDSTVVNSAPKKLRCIRAQVSKCKRS